MTRGLSVVPVELGGGDPKTGQLAVKEEPGLGPWLPVDHTQARTGHVGQPGNRAGHLGP